MRRQKLVALAGIITLAIAGCASEETAPVATSPSPSATTAPSPVASPSAAPATPSASPSPGKAGGAATTNQKPGLPTVAGLIQPTNSQERARQVETEIKGDKNKNPFEGLQPAMPKAGTTTKPVPKVEKLPGTRTGGTGSRSPGNTGGGAGTGGGLGTGGGPAAQPKTEIASPAIPKEGEPLGFNLPPEKPASKTAALPPPPSTDTAKAVEVTGVVTVGSTTQAIVVAPGDATSRYVSVGQRISNGKVLVKRIEMRDGSEPIVILEENGVEVAKAVGEKPAQPAKSAA